MSESGPSENSSGPDVSEGSIHASSRRANPLQYTSISPTGITFVDSSLLVNSAAAVAAAAAKQLVQGQAKLHNMQTSNGSTIVSGLVRGRQQKISPSANTDTISSIAQAALSQAHQNNSTAGNVPAHIMALLSSGTVGTPQSVTSSSTSQSQYPFSSSSFASIGEQSSIPGISNTQSNFTPIAQVVAARAAVAASSGAMAGALLPSMHNWPLDQLEQHVKLLQQMNRPIPQSAALLLADARRKEQKKTAKRVANRKSACTSRARKKAFVEEMTRTNARLRRQALILALIPDLVITISEKGEITFCSAQVERVLQHQVNDLIGASIYEILTPDSRDALRDLMKKLVQSDDSRAVAHVDNEKGDKRGRHDSGGSVAVVSDQSSFPLSVVVKVESKQATMDENDTSDGSAGGKQQASLSLTNSTNSGSEDGTEDRKKGVNTSNGTQNVNISTSISKTQRLSSSDESSTETKNLRNANENLDRNVRWHNITLQSKSKSLKSKAGHKDDVTGASVTANNASARLSSLQHVPASVIASNTSNMLPSSQHVPEQEQSGAKSKTKPSRYGNFGDHSSSEDSLLSGAEEKKKRPNENSSDDSGYRESNDCSEETSSTSDSLNSNGRQKPLAPTCNVCLIRSNLTKLWCEVTSSIRNQSSSDNDDDSEDLINVAQGKVGQQKSSSRSLAGSKTSKSSASTSEEILPPKENIKEILLCLRPIRDGDNEVDPSLRFNPKPVTPIKNQISSSISGDQSNDGGSSSNPNTSKLPKKHRPPVQESNESRRKRMRIMANSPIRNSETEKSVVESLMLMSNKS